MRNPAKTTVFKNADWVVAWDKQRESHVYLRNASLAMRGSEIVHVGTGDFSGEVDIEVDAQGKILMPGLVNIHCHTPAMPNYRGVIEEVGNPNFWYNALYEVIGHFFPQHPDEQAAATTVALCELLLSGSTTCLDMEFPFDHDKWIAPFAASGIRGIISPLYSSARIVAASNSELRWEWDADGGQASFERALAAYDAANSHSSSLITGMLSPLSPDTCTPELLRSTMLKAQELRSKVHIHAAMSPNEFHEMVRRHGRTPIQHLADLGVLGPQTIIGHGVIIDEHPWVNWHTHEDINLMGRSGTSLSHCPSVYARDGYKLETYRKYRDAGVTIGLGTDNSPHNLIEEMRALVMIGRVAEGNMTAVMTSEAFNAATVDAARAIGRDDIGRLGVGAKADILVVDAKNPWMMPVYDPIRCFVYHAADRALQDVYVEGRQVVRDRQVLTLDHAAALEVVAETLKKTARSMPDRDRQRRTAEEVAPPVYPFG